MRFRLQEAITWFMIGIMSLLIVIPVLEEQQDPGWLVRVLLWIDRHLTGGGGGGEQGEDPPPHYWGGGHSPDWND